MCRGSRSIACLARTLPVLCARRTLPWVRVALTAHHHTRGTTVPSQQRDELALGLGIPLDVALRHGQAGMAGEFLDVPETPPDLGDFARGTRNEADLPLKKALEFQVLSNISASYMDRA